jgi:hypothetical protein
MAPVSFEQCPEDDVFAEKGSDRHGFKVSWLGLA